MAETILDVAMIREDGSETVLGRSDSFPWWSFTKCALAICALRLAEEGLLKLDEPWHHEPFTLRQLLQHRAGIPDYGMLAAYHEAVERRDAPWPRAKLLAEVQAHKLLFRPGSGWGYSNIGYLFVREAIEDAAKMDLGDALNHYIIHQLALPSVSLALKSSDFDSVPGGGGGYDPGWVYHGCLLGTPLDAARLLVALFHGKLLMPETLQSMLDIVPVGGAIPGRPWMDCSYGLGLMCGKVDGPGRAIGHSGAGPFCANAVYYFPDVVRPVVVAGFTSEADEAVAEWEVVQAACQIA